MTAKKKYFDSVTMSKCRFYHQRKLPKSTLISVLFTKSKLTFLSFVNLLQAVNQIISYQLIFIFDIEEQDSMFNLIPLSSYAALMKLLCCHAWGAQDRPQRAL